MEGSDLFVRTLDDHDVAVPVSDDESEPELQAAEQEKPFFEAERPAGWDLSEARARAEKQLPFQTTVETKIRATMAKIGATQVPAVASKSEKSNDKHEVKKSRCDVVDEPKRRKKRKRNEQLLSFDDLNLSRALLKALGVLQWTTPTPVQSRAIPFILAGRDVLGSATTGSGKTGAFVLPILERLIQAGLDNVTRVVILLPTRELAAQCHSVVTNLAKYTTIRSVLAVGGLSNVSQETALRTRPHILVATPGRLIDHMRNAHSFSLDDVEILILDEADRLLDMGFKDEVEEVLRHTPRSRQTLLFSATMNSRLGALAKLSLQNPARLAVDALHDVATTLSQEFVKLKTAHETNKDAVLLSLAHRTYKRRVIVFFKQKVLAHRFRILFGIAGLRCDELHGNLTQAQRLLALDRFRRADVDFLLCTDLAARGLDIAGVETVINFDMPGELTEYVHRVGRTARAGKAGRCCSLVCSDRAAERRVLNAVAKRARSQLAARVVPPAVVGKWRAWIDAMQGAIRNVLKDEKSEMLARVAEMEIQKAQNLMKHSDEIYGRPKRTWFQSTGEKEMAKELGRKDKGLGPSRKEIEKREREKNKAELKDERRKGTEKAKVDMQFGKQRGAAKKLKRRRK